MWGGSLTRDFRKNIENTKELMARYRGKDLISLEEFSKARSRYGVLLTQKEAFREQRLKQFWLAAGDSDMKYFHAMASTRKKNNRILRLKDSNGVWRDQDSGLNDIILGVLPPFVHFG